MPENAAVVTYVPTEDALRRADRAKSGVIRRGYIDLVDEAYSEVAATIQDAKQAKGFLAHHRRTFPTSGEFSIVSLEIRRDNLR